MLRRRVKPVRFCFGLSVCRQTLRNYSLSLRNRAGWCKNEQRLRSLEKLKLPGVGSVWEDALGGRVELLFSEMKILLQPDESVRTFEFKSRPDESQTAVGNQSGHQDPAAGLDEDVLQCVWLCCPYKQTVGDHCTSRNQHPLLLTYINDLQVITVFCVLYVGGVGPTGRPAA